MKTQNTLRIFFITALALLMALIVGCEKKKTETPVTVPEVTTVAPSCVTQLTARTGGKVLNNGGATVKDRGMCWSTAATPTMADNVSKDGIGSGAFTSTITGLSPNTTYYARAYANNSAGTGLGNIITFKTTEMVYDNEGQVCLSIKIGTQEWTANNLSVRHYNNGDSIPNITSDSLWEKLKTGAYCDYANTPANSITYGKLYNYYTVVDPRNVCPSGFHVPSDSDWTVLTTYLGGESVAGDKLKETGTNHWERDGGGRTDGGTNDFGFTALPGGYRDDTGPFYSIRLEGYWWSSTELENYDSYLRNITAISKAIYRGYNHKENGFSVQCVKN